MEGNPQGYNLAPYPTCNTWDRAPQQRIIQTKSPGCEVGPVTQIVGPGLGVSDSVGLGWGLRICISIKFPSEAAIGLELHWRTTDLERKKDFVPS